MDFIVGVTEVGGHGTGDDTVPELRFRKTSSFYPYVAFLVQLQGSAIRDVSSSSTGIAWGDVAPVNSTDVPSAIHPKDRPVLLFSGLANEHIKSYYYDTKNIPKARIDLVSTGELSLFIRPISVSNVENSGKLFSNERITILFNEYQDTVTRLTVVDNHMTLRLSTDRINLNGWNHLSFINFAFPEPEEIRKFILINGNVAIDDARTRIEGNTGAFTNDSVPDGSFMYFGSGTSDTAFHGYLDSIEMYASYPRSLSLTELDVSVPKAFFDLPVIQDFSSQFFINGAAPLSTYLTATLYVNGIAGENMYSRATDRFITNDVNLRPTHDIVNGSYVTHRADVVTSVLMVSRHDSLSVLTTNLETRHDTITKAARQAAIIARHDIITGTWQASRHDSISTLTIDLTTRHDTITKAARQSLMTARHDVVTGSYTAGRHDSISTLLTDLTTRHDVIGNLEAKPIVVPTEIVARHDTITKSARQAAIIARHDIVTGSMQTVRHDSLSVLLSDLSTRHDMINVLANYKEIVARHDVVTRSMQATHHDSISMLLVDLTARHDIVTSVITNLETRHDSISRLNKYKNLDTWHDVVTTVKSFNANVISIADRYLMHNNIRYEISDYSLVDDNDSYGVTGSCQVADVNILKNLREGDEVSLFVMSQEWKLIASSISKEKTPRNVTVNIELINKLALKSNEYIARKISYSNTEKTAKEIAEDILGETIEWNIINWLVKEKLLVVLDTSPLDAVRELISAVKGCIGVNPDGTIFVNYRLSDVKSSDWDKKTPDIELSEENNLLSVQTVFEPTERFGRVEVYEADSIDRNWQISSELIGSFAAIITIRTNPWLPPEKIDLYHTGSINVSIDKLFEVFETIEEELEFKGGAASASQPIYEILNVSWRYVNLGELYHKIDEKELIADDPFESMAIVKYKTRKVQAKARNSVEETTQFVAREKLWQS